MCNSLNEPGRGLGDIHGKYVWNGQRWRCWEHYREDVRGQLEWQLSTRDLDTIRGPSLECTPGYGLPPRVNPPAEPGTRNMDHLGGWFWVKGEWKVLVHCGRPGPLEYCESD